MIRLAVLPDYREEGWPSMDLCADQLLAHATEIPDVAMTRVAPPFRNCFTRLPVVGGWGGGGAARNADRLMNRLRDYPSVARSIAGEFDFFHVVDHSYSQLVRELPAGRAGVFCHDLDTFRCVLEPHLEPRPRWFRAMVRRILDGFQRAAVVFYTTEPIREAILRHGLVPESRLVKCPLGVSPAFRVERSPTDVATVDRLTGGGPFLLHVGSTIPRKRIDVLLDVAAAVIANRPGVKLVKVGGEFSAEQEAKIDAVGLRASLVHARGVSDEDLAALYRSAAAVLQPSEAEGFGLPVIEALACGASVVATDLPVLREVGGQFVAFAPLADVEAWQNLVLTQIDSATGDEERGRRAASVARYQWGEYARTIGETYRRVAGN